MNLSNEKNKNLGSIKILDPVVPENENGNTDVVKKLGQMEKTDETCGALEVAGVSSAPASKTTRFNPINDDRLEKVEDMGNLTAAELRKTQTGKLASNSIYFLFHQHCT